MKTEHLTLRATAGTKRRAEKLAEAMEASDEMLGRVGVTPSKALAVALEEGLRALEARYLPKGKKR